MSLYNDARNSKTRYVPFNSDRKKNKMLISEHKSSWKSLCTCDLKFFTRSSFSQEILVIVLNRRACENFFFFARDCLQQRRVCDMTEHNHCLVLSYFIWSNFQMLETLSKSIFDQNFTAKQQIYSFLDPSGRLHRPEFAEVRETSGPENGSGSI